MKKCVNIIVAAFVIIGKVQAFPADKDQGEGRSWPVLQKDVGILWATLEPQLYSSSDKPNRIHFYLYTQGNSTEAVEIDLNDPETLTRSTYDFRNPTIFMIHGWKDEYTGGANGVIRSALFEEGLNRKLNFISVDWRVYSQFENYKVSQELCSTAGKVVAQFIDWMHENAKLQFDTLTLYGHSMGAQVAGFAGKNVQQGKIHSIIGMDPALPLFPLSDPKGRLADTDAEYVETIHTNGGYWGFYQPIGQTAFYPNGGKYQPGCGSDLDGLCSHERAVLFLAEVLGSSEKNEFHAVRCDELKNVEEGNCDQYESIIRMGDPRNALLPRGIYYLKTNSESPYGRGTTNILDKRRQKIKKYLRR